MQKAHGNGPTDAEHLHFVCEALNRAGRRATVLALALSVTLTRRR